MVVISRRGIGATDLPPCTRMMGLPVRVIVISEMRRAWFILWFKFKASFRLDRTAVGKEAILARYRGCKNDAAFPIAKRELVMFEAFGILDFTCS